MESQSQATLSSKKRKAVSDAEKVAFELSKLTPKQAQQSKVKVEDAAIHFVETLSCTLSAPACTWKDRNKSICYCPKAEFKFDSTMPDRNYLTRYSVTCSECYGEGESTFHLYCSYCDELLTGTIAAPGGKITDHVITIRHIYKEAVAVKDYFERQGFVRAKEHDKAKEYIAKLECWTETIKFTKGSLRKSDFEEILSVLRTQVDGARSSSQHGNAAQPESVMREHLKETAAPSRAPQPTHDEHSQHPWDYSLSHPITTSQMATGAGYGTDDNGGGNQGEPIPVSQQAAHRSQEDVELAAAEPRRHHTSEGWSSSDHQPMGPSGVRSGAGMMPEYRPVSAGGATDPYTQIISTIARDSFHAGQPLLCSDGFTYQPILHGEAMDVASNSRIVWIPVFHRAVPSEGGGGGSGGAGGTVQMTVAPLPGWSLPPFEQQHSASPGAGPTIGGISMISGLLPPPLLPKLIPPPPRPGPRQPMLRQPQEQQAPKPSPQSAVAAWRSGYSGGVAYPASPSQVLGGYGAALSKAANAPPPPPKFDTPSFGQVAARNEAMEDGGGDGGLPGDFGQGSLIPLGLSQEPLDHDLYGHEPRARGHDPRIQGQYSYDHVGQMVQGVLRRMRTAASAEVGAVTSRTRGGLEGRATDRHPGVVSGIRCGARAGAGLGRQRPQPPPPLKKAAAGAAARWTWRREKGSSCHGTCTQRDALLAPAAAV